MAVPTRLILLTVSFPHAVQLHKLRHCARALSIVPNTLWLVAEDAAVPTPAVSALLRSTGKPHRHLAIGPTRKGGNAQREALLQLVRRERLDGIVYNMDDDNAYHPALWAELRRLQPLRVGIVAVRRGAYPPPPCDGVFDVMLLRSDTLNASPKGASTPALRACRCAMTASVRSRRVTSPALAHGRTM